MEKEMKNKWHDTIRKRLQTYRKECLSCLYPGGDYAWGTLRKNISNTLNLVNKIVKGIPVQAWPDKDSYEGYPARIAFGGWTMKLGWKDGQRTADLRYRNDNHTAWCIENSRKPGVFINFDIGGS